MTEGPADAARAAAPGTEPGVEPGAEPGACRAIARLLSDAGIRRVYTVPGDLIYGLLRALEQAGISICSCRSQATAVFASAADSLACGVPASAVVVSRGPAAKNAVAALSAVRAHGTPILLLTVTEPRTEEARGAFQGGGVDPAGLPGTLCLRVASPEGLTTDAPVAVQSVLAPDFGAAVIEIERGVLDGVVRGAIAAPKGRAAAHTGEPAWLPRTVALLGGARRPVVVVGHAARWSVPVSALAELAARLDAPLCPTGLTGGFGGNDLDVVPQELAHHTLAAADAVLLLGADLDWTLRFGAALAPSARIVQLCRRAGAPGGRRPDLAVPGDIGANLAQLLRHLPARDASDARPAPIVRRRQAQSLTDQVLRAIADAFPANAAFVVDGSSALVFAGRVVLPDKCWARFTPGIEGHLGAGIGHSIGAVRSGRFGQAVAVVGDFSLGLSLADLETLLRYALPVKVLVANNFGIAAAGGQMAGADPRAVRYSAATDHAGIMRAFGGTGYSVGSLEDWRGIAPAVLSGAGPCLVDIIERRDPA
ncbi:hypothetical protein GE300_14165 [Rhodobacteraceae bacterium 2CG4]|uniref:Acetolactate synthase-1/2/3 large subunit n=1 Tax=Halovulum marinum TaxID=2662447 RepID=A0A6L5Z425_9RHOB|nr:thiamine pyrophosphate-binding protein [Halovulum marinum]MSU90744.1 hypothetical protein [Halovulum marinum]